MLMVCPAASKWGSEERVRMVCMVFYVAWGGDPGRMASIILTSPMEDLLKKEAEYRWTTCHQKSLQQIKDLICKEMLLTYFDPSKETLIQVDASNKGQGAVLLQEGKPIAFASKSLMEKEQWYANVEWELLSFIFRSEWFRTYIYIYIYRCAF